MEMVKEGQEDMDIDNSAAAISKNSESKKSKQTLNDFGGMGDLLTQIESKMEK